MMKQAIIEQEDAEAYIRALFEYVLGRASTTPAEIENWAHQIMAGHSVAEILRLFVASEEYRLRQQALV